MKKGLLTLGMAAWSVFTWATTPTTVVVEPLCKATEAWNQAGALNAYVHLGMNYPCGCDPLAWGQIVTYHGLVTKFPAKGWKPKPTTGQVALCDSTGALINFETRTTLPGEYNWEDIRDQGAGVSRLMRDLGALGNTAYRPGGTSGTFGSKNAVDYFNYQNAGYLYEPPFYWEGNNHLLQSNWSELVESQLRASLQAGAPMVMTVTNNAGGHAIVCDGYGYAADGTLLFHVNYGWGGGGNRWEPLSWFSYFPGTYDSKFQFQTITFNTHPNPLGCVLAGRVVRNKAGVEGVTILLTTAGNPTPQEVTTNAVGAYVITGLSEKTDYTITVKEDGEVVGTRQITTGRFVDSPARNLAQDAWEKEHGKDGHHVPIEGGNVTADFDLPVPKVYVTATGTGDGTTWASAAGLTKTFLETVLAGTEVHVAAGNYTVREMLTVPVGVTLMGGYNATTDARNVYGTPTTITMGTGAYGYPPSYIFEVKSDAIVDGFVLENSQSWSSGTVQGGTVKNCIFTGTYEKIAESATLQCCIMRNISATQEGCSLIHCTFYGEVPAGKDGGGTVAGCLEKATADYPSADKIGTCTCGQCPENGLNGSPLEKTPGALSTSVQGYSIYLN